MFNNLSIVGFKLPNIRCSSCVKLVKVLLMEFPGIYGVYSSYTNKILVIDCDSAIADIKLLTQTIKEIGFSTRLIFNFPIV